MATGVAIQRALGIASAYESEADAHGAAPLVTREPVCSDPRAETLRLIAVEAARELADALGGSAPAPENAPSGDPVLAFRSRMLAVQGELSAPALLAKSTREVRDVMQLLVQLLLEPSHVNGDGGRVNALSVGARAAPAQEAAPHAQRGRHAERLRRHRLRGLADRAARAGRGRGAAPATELRCASRWPRWSADGRAARSTSPANRISRR